VETGEGGGGSIFWETPDTALYSTYVSTLWATLCLKLAPQNHVFNLTFTEDDLLMREQMLTWWTDFAKNGSPDGDTLWKPFTIRYKKNKIKTFNYEALKYT
jgi:hypothetical protein